MSWIMIGNGAYLEEVSLLDYEDFCHLKETIHPFRNRSDTAEALFTRARRRGNSFINAVA
jgi:hypothetical protein